MKTTILALAAAMPLMAGTPAYIETEPVNPYSIEAAVSYNFAARDMFKFGDFKGPKVDTLGVDITGMYTVNSNSSFNLRFGFATGSDDKNYEDLFKMRARVNNFYLMPGYRYTHPMGEYVSGFIGANIGIINQSVKLKISDSEFESRGHGSDYGFAYSAEVGLRYEISKHFDVFVAYQFFGSTAEVGGSHSHGNDEDWGAKLSAQLYHCVRAGVSFDF